MNIYKFVCYDEPECRTLSFSDFSYFEGTVTEENKKKLYIFPDNCSGSDSSGKSYCVSNYEVFLRDYWDYEGVYKLTGGHNSYGIAVRYDVYENNNDITEAINCLECEAVLDDEHFNNLEQEWINEAIYNSYNDIYGEIFMDDDFDDDPEIENQELIEQWIREGIEHLKIDFVYEYTSCYFDTKKIIPYIKDRLILCRKHLPLYTNREWSCEDTKMKFLERIANGSFT